MWPRKSSSYHILGRMLNMGVPGTSMQPTCTLGTQARAPGPRSLSFTLMQHLLLQAAAWKQLVLQGIELREVSSVKWQRIRQGKVGLWTGAVGGCLGPYCCHEFSSCTHFQTAWSHFNTVCQARTCLTSNALGSPLSHSSLTPVSLPSHSCLTSKKDHAVGAQRRCPTLAPFGPRLENQEWLGMPPLQYAALSVLSMQPPPPNRIMPSVPQDCAAWPSRGVGITCSQKRRGAGAVGGDRSESGEVRVRAFSWCWHHLQPGGGASRRQRGGTGVRMVCSSSETGPRQE